MSGRVNWPAVLDRLAEEIDASGVNWTLRQLYYVGAARLGLFPLTQSAYKRLSETSAEARRQGTFPQLVDGTRSIVQRQTDPDPQTFLRGLETAYFRDLTQDQETSVWVGVEKQTLQAQVSEWVEPYGIPVAVLRGFGSQTYIDDISDQLVDRYSLCLYVGDHDATGHAIDRDLRRRCDFHEVRRVALTSELVESHGIEPVDGKPKDPNWPRFANDFDLDPNRPVQWEVEGLDPTALRTLVIEAVEAELDLSLIEEQRQREAAERRQLREYFAAFEVAS